MNLEVTLTGEKHIEAMIEMCLDSKDPKQELIKLFKTTFQDNWKMCCSYRQQTREIVSWQVLQFMSSYLDVKDEQEEIKKLHNRFLNRHGVS